MKEGLTVEYAREVYSVEKSQNDGRAKVSLLCPTKVIYSRADTLNTPTVTIVKRPQSQHHREKANSAVGFRSSY